MIEPQPLPREAWPAALEEAAQHNRYRKASLVSGVACLCLVAFTFAINHAKRDYATGVSLSVAVLMALVACIAELTHHYTAYDRRRTEVALQREVQARAARQDGTFVLQV